MIKTWLIKDLGNSNFQSQHCLGALLLAGNHYTDIIMKIESHQCYPIIFVLFQWGWEKKIKQRIENRGFKKIFFLFHPHWNQPTYDYCGFQPEIGHPKQYWGYCTFTICMTYFFVCVYTGTLRFWRVCYAASTLRKLCTWQNVCDRKWWLPLTLRSKFG